MGKIQSYPNPHQPLNCVTPNPYEYLMRHFAIACGKGKGYFYIPAEIGQIVAKVIGIGPANTKASTTVHDPICGSGSLLLKVAAEAGKHITLEGQEKDATYAGLARMNMILHDFPTANIATGNALSDPKFKDGEHLRTYDYVVAGVPFSDKEWSTGITLGQDRYQRFTWGEPPAKQGDYAFLLHIIRSLKSTGKGACILPHGVLFRGNAEGLIRTKLVRSGYLKGIIGLPANLFYGTGIPACILVLDKENAAARKGIFMIDASKGFIKDGPKNRLREQDIHRIVDTFTRQVEILGYARLVTVAEISDAKNDYNLNLPRYIDSTEPEDLQDITAHLRGGIPDRDLDGLKPYWQVFPAVRAALFSEVVSSPVSLPKGMQAAYAETHFQQAEHGGDWPEEFAIITAYATTGEKWTAAENDAADRALEADLKMKSSWVRRITGYSPSTGHGEPGWAVTLSFEAACKVGVQYKQDAIYFVKNDTLSVSFCDARKKQVEIGPFRPRVHTSASHPIVRPGYSQLRIPAAEIKPAIFDHAEFTDFNATATRLFGKWKKDTGAKLKTAQDALIVQVAARYGQLTEAEIQSLVVDDKWLATLAAAVQGELDRVSQTFTGRIRQLADRYATPLPQLTGEVANLAARVDSHLQKMGCTP